MLQVAPHFAGVAVVALPLAVPPAVVQLAPAPAALDLLLLLGCAVQ